MPWKKEVLGQVAGAVAGSLFDGGFGLANNFMSFEQNMALQHDAQSWQERMSNTAHQREVADLENAGLNPRLSAMNGNGASTGSVGANSVNPQPIRPAETFLNLLNSSAQYDFTKSQAENMRQDSVLKGTQVLAERQRVSNMIQELEESKSRVRHNESKVKEIDAHIRLMTKQLDALDSTIQLNFATQNQAVANTHLINNQVKKVQAETKYTNERSRGFTESWTDSSGKDVRVLGVGTGSNTSTSYSRNY